MTPAEEKTWTREADKLSKLPESEQVSTIGLIRGLAVGTKGRKLAEQRARFIERRLGLKKPHTLPPA